MLLGDFDVSNLIARIPLQVKAEIGKLISACRDPSFPMAMCGLL